MTIQVRELAKQTIDELSENDIIELMEFINNLHRKQTRPGQDNHRELHAILDELSQECSRDNWDGYGAKALQSGSYREALRFIQKLPTIVPVPDIAIDPDGMVAFEWENVPRKIFSISVGESGELIYAGIFKNSKTHGTEFLEDGIPRILLDHLQRLFFS